MSAYAFIREACMSDKIYPVAPEWAKKAYVDGAGYKEMY
ncbi:hypothetical protein QBC99_005384, partial [Beijerinckia sp. GAS462]|nr:hypothetical protein [Beijerinckia sp. GAS462]